MKNQFDKIKLGIIAAVDANGALGYKGDLLFHVKEDLQHFKDFTYGDTVIMGYNTFLSLKRPAGLPNRVNAVLYDGPDFYEVSKKYPDVKFERSISDALTWAFTDAVANNRNTIWFIGGASVYAEAIKKYADFVELTVFSAKADKADVYFPMGYLLGNFKVERRTFDYSKDNEFVIEYVRLVRYAKAMKNHAAMQEKMHMDKRAASAPDEA